MPCQCLPSLATKRTKGTLPPTKLPIPGGGLISLHIRQASSSNCARLKFAKTLCVVLKFSSPLSVERLSALSYLRVLWSDCLLLYRLQTPGTLITTARTSVPITTQPSNIDRCLKTGIKIHEHKTVEQTAMTRWRYGGNGNTRSYTRLTDVIAARQYWCSLSAAHALTPIQAPHHTLMQPQEKKFFKRNKSLWIHVVEILASFTWEWRYHFHVIMTCTQSEGYYDVWKFNTTNLASNHTQSREIYTNAFTNIISACF